METEGPHFLATIEALRLDEAQATDAKKNSTRIVQAIMRAFGTSSSGNLDPQITPPPTTGLVYGRIQSGKTRAMIASTAMAFDNGFRIAVVLTSNINDLVEQTHIDFSRGLPGIMMFTKDTDLQREEQITKLHLERGNGCLLLICSKGAKSLPNIASFLRSIDAALYPGIIFDDEGDQASLDTNIRRRATLPVAVAPSAINGIIQNRLRTSIPKHIYVSVTGTPQAVLLQSADSANRPSFIVMLPPGPSYIGGDAFFDSDEPEDNPRLIALVDANEKQRLLQRSGPIPEGLKRSILFFLVSAAAAIRNMGMPPRGYSYLCHPSLKNDEQDRADDRINRFLAGVLSALYDGQSNEIVDALKAQRGALASTLGTSTPSFEEIRDTLLQQLPIKSILVINARVKRHGIAYGSCLNFLIGGNTLGRGIAIRDLLVTYYIREAKVSQIDTMHQHARMFGYRSPTLAYTRLFIPRHLYYRFRDIHRSDTELRRFIERHKDTPATFPVEYTPNMRATRVGVLDVNKTGSITPGMQIYPNYVRLPQNSHVYSRKFRMLQSCFGAEGVSEDGLEQAGQAGVQIDTEMAQQLVAGIKTGSENTWRDATIGTVIANVASKYGGKLNLRYRMAERTVRDGGFISTGTLSGDELQNGRRSSSPTLWLMAVRTARGSAVGEGLKFIYPTLVVPNRFPNLFIFNRG